MKFPRIVRLDASDERIFASAARAGEPAVTGSFVFVFSDVEPEALAGPEKQAFVRGFLGTESFGWGTLVVISELTQAEYEGVVGRLADHFVEHYGAPDREAALPHAREEVAFAAGLCEHPVNTLLAVEREWAGEGIDERFRVIVPRADWEGGGRVWELAPEEPPQLGGES
jgi:hypothetical protein